MFHILMGLGCIAVTICQNFTAEVPKPFCISYTQIGPIIIIWIVLIHTHKVIVIIIIIEWEVGSQSGIDVRKDFYNYWSWVMEGGSSLYCSLCMCMIFSVIKK